MPDRSTTVTEVNYLRKAGLYLTLALSFFSLLFYQYAGLYFFLEERAELYPVRELKSQGGDEDFLIGIGVAIFLLLALVYLLRWKKPLSKTDVIALFIALLIQGFALFLIDVGSFVLSVQASYGWILVLWFITFGSLWTLLIATILHLRR